MMKDSMDQVIIISGESGAGKTGNKLLPSFIPTSIFCFDFGYFYLESTKLLMQYLAAVCLHTSLNLQ